MFGARSLSLTATVLLACSDSGPSQGGAGIGGGPGAGGEGGAPLPPVVTVLHPDQTPLPGETECVVTITDNHPLEGRTHVEVCSPVAYQTNPPSSGDHWPIWAEFRSYDAPVPRSMLVHNLEHGAVIMLYRCDADCPEIPAAYEEAADTFGLDPLCVMGSNNAERSRIVIAPDPELDAPIGLASWRATYVATCLDPPSILEFIETHYGRGLEQVCAQGKDPADPATGVPLCAAD